MASEGAAAPAAPLASARTPAFAILLIALTAAAPLSLQIFLPALPAIQAGFGVGAGAAQLVLSLSILANAFATLAYGPLSDRHGRRPTILVGLVLFVLGSLLSTVAPSITLLIVARIVQAVGAAAGMVLARAIVRDLYDRERSAEMIAYLTMAMVVAPMLAPLLGAILTEISGWRAIFAFVSLFALLLLWQSAVRLVETRGAGAIPLGGGSLLAGAGWLLRQGAFLAYMLQSTFSIAVFFSFIAGAPYFMIDVLDRPVTEYGLYFMLVSAGFMAGNFTAARISARTGLDRMIMAGTVLALAATAVSAALLAAGLWHPLSLFGPMTAAAYANGLTVPNAQAGAVSVDPALAGTASGLSGFSQMFVAALVSQAVGVLHNGTPYPMIAFMVVCAALALLGFVLPRRLTRGPS
jgi:MFS transporter, DHA1 family, multidrug resistance protein